MAEDRTLDESMDLIALQRSRGMCAEIVHRLQTDLYALADVKRLIDDDYDDDDNTLWRLRREIRSALSTAYVLRGDVDYLLRERRARAEAHSDQSPPLNSYSETV